MTESLRRFLSSEEGAELAEYAVGVALLVAIALVVLKVLGNAINDENEGTAADSAGRQRRRRVLANARGSHRAHDRRAFNHFLKLFREWSYQVNRLKEFLKAEDGAELAEYAVGTAILVAIAIVVYAVLGDAVNNKMNAVANEVDAPPPAGP